MQGGLIWFSYKVRTSLRLGNSRRKASLSWGSLNLSRAKGKQGFLRGPRGKLPKTLQVVGEDAGGGGFSTTSRLRFEGRLGQVDLQDTHNKKERVSHQDKTLALSPSPFLASIFLRRETICFLKPTIDADAEQLQYLSWTFMWFEAIPQLKVNPSKTEAILVGEGIPMETPAPVLGCKIGSLPTSYLGLPLGAPYKSTRVWDVVEERFKKRECARLEKIQRDFLWGGGALENRPHLVSWKIICAAKKDGGMGIHSLSILNKALLGKWLWRFANENDPLWKQIISRKYSFQEGGWCSKGDGTRVKFWKDLWCENQSLEDAFPNLFNLTANKEGWIAKAWEEDGVGGSWGLRFNRHLNDWEIGEVESLLSKLHPLTIRRGVDDLLWWGENKNETFSVKSFITRSQGALELLSRLELLGRLGF
ncbi:putative ribonuclease H protein [Vitis vinifera]|uniref:Putative ribonuclease H protein n=1 Tax=Vitis vinifera TaxID=29760 RepID=A0A438K1L3_VITVI|nr:putative ribonuclease H protein [Vitis vinifera]